MTQIKFISLCFWILTGCLGCKKLVEIAPPTNSITTSQVFADSSDAQSAITGVYSSLSYTSNLPSIGSGSLTLYCGLSSDELLLFNNAGDFLNLQENTVLANNGPVYLIWRDGYTTLYLANAIIEGLQNSTSISQATKNKFTGEAKFIRAFLDFYLANLYGDIPLITSTNYKSNAVANRTPALTVYNSIIADLLDAQALLPNDYSAGNGERIRANKWTATALLARVYLYRSDWANAEALATSIISNSAMYSLTSSPNDVFLTNSTEAILQWQNNSTTNKYLFNATEEGYTIIPFNSTSFPSYYLSNQLLNDFEPLDLRKKEWLDSTTYNGSTYYYPYKYKVGSPDYAANAPVTQYYTVLRLAEQYLIRAEARAQQKNSHGAIADLNVIRERAGLPDLSAFLNQDQLLAAVAQERRIELFAEWGHRWLDLKRTGQVNAAFNTIPYKAPYKSYQQLYPIPFAELQNDPNLTQNPLY